MGGNIFLQKNIRGREWLDLGKESRVIISRIIATVPTIIMAANKRMLTLGQVLS